MYISLNIGDYILYRSSSMHGYWLVCKIYDYTTTTNGMSRYYKYEVLKKSNAEYVEDVGTKSVFMHGSVFHAGCSKIDDIDDSRILAMVL